MLMLLFGLPLFFAVAWLYLLVRGPRRGLNISLVAFVATFAAGAWSIRFSSSSTVAIGFLFMPGIAAVSGLLSMLFAQLRVNPGPPIRAVAWLCLLASAGVPIVMVTGGTQQQARNQASDREQDDLRRRLDANRLAIAELMRANAGREEAVLDAEIEKHRDDPMFLRQALGTSFASEDRLDQFAGREDLNLASIVARNPRTRSATLERMYRTNSHPPDLFAALAENRNTPVEILRQLANHPEPIDRNSIETALMRNPSTPLDVRNSILDAMSAR